MPTYLPTSLHTYMPTYLRTYVLHACLHIFFASELHWICLEHSRYAAMRVAPSLRLYVWLFVSLYVCMSLCLYVCMYVCMYMYVLVCICARGREHLGSKCTLQQYEYMRSV